MKHQAEIESVLDRSLHRQIRVRHLDESFDAAVWARIEAEESKAAVRTPARPAAAKVARWMSVVNAVGIACVAVVLCVIMFQWLAGVRIEATIPDFSSRLSQQDASAWSTGIAGAALLFGFLYTPWGRRLRDELF